MLHSLRTILESAAAALAQTYEAMSTEDIKARLITIYENVYHIMKVKWANPTTGDNQESKTTDMRQLSNYGDESDALEAILRKRGVAFSVTSDLKISFP